MRFGTCGDAAQRARRFTGWYALFLRINTLFKPNSVDDAVKWTKAESSVCLSDSLFSVSTGGVTNEFDVEAVRRVGRSGRVLLRNDV
jgi:hypothetical protein